MPSSSRRLLVLIAALLALAALPTAASAADPGVVLTGVETRIDPTGKTAEVLEGWAPNRRWARIFVSWPQIQPNNANDYEDHILRGFEARVDALRQENVSVLMVVTNAPGWSQESPSSDITVPPKPEHFANFMAYMAGRFARTVGAWELWNEQDEAVFWKGGPNPAAYAALVKAAYPRIKDAARAYGANPLVVTGGLVGNNYPFVEKLYDHGIKGHFDAVGVHTDTACLLREPEFYYREDNGRLGRFAFTAYREVRRTMLAHGDDKPIWMTEIGWSTTPGICNVGVDAGRKPGGVSEDQQADFLRRAYRCLAGDPFVSVALWFSLQDYSDSTDYDHRLGLIRRDGTQKPGFAALKQTFTGAGPTANPDCGGKVDADPPTVSLTVPAEYFERLSVRAKASDPTTTVTRMELYANGKKVPGSQDGGTFSLDWLGARDLPYGEQKIEVRAYDEAKNVGRATATVVHQDPRRARPTVEPRFEFKVRRRPGRRLLITSSVRKPAANAPAESPKGRVRVFFERKVGRRWKPTSRFTKGIKRRIVIDYKARKPGTWRVWARFAAQPPYKSVRTRHHVFRLR